MNSWIILSKNIFKKKLSTLINKDFRDIYISTFKFFFWGYRQILMISHRKTVYPRTLTFCTRYMEATLIICAKFEQNRSWYRVTLWAPLMECSGYEKQNRNYCTYDWWFVAMNRCPNKRCWHVFHTHILLNTLNTFLRCIKWYNISN